MPTKKRAKPQPPVPVPAQGPRPYLTISKEFFENYFWLDGPGRKIVLDALSAGVISTSYEAVDMLCVANQMMQGNIHALLVVEMHHRGRTIDYRAAKTPEEMGRLTREAIECLGHDKFVEIVRLAEENARMVLRVAESDAEWIPWSLTTPVN